VAVVAGPCGEALSGLAAPRPGNLGNMASIDTEPSGDAEPLRSSTEGDAHYQAPAEPGSESVVAGRTRWLFKSARNSRKLGPGRDETT
jgi:hypothetical protein